MADGSRSIWQNVAVRRSPATWWHLLSLDAPTVAMVWCCTFAYACGIQLRASTPLLLGLATWIAYVADRLLDAHLARDPARLRDRHLFYGYLLREHRNTVLAAFALAVVGCIAWGAVALPFALIVGYAALSTASMIYFAGVHWGGAKVERLLPKEAAVGTIFAIGSALPAWIAARGTMRSDLEPMIAMFAAVCWLNCVAIERWEATWFADDHALGVGHGSTRWAAARLGVLLLVGASLSVCLVFLEAVSRPFEVLGILLGAAFVLLFLIEKRHAIIHARKTRVLADAVLLTPLPWLCWALFLRR